MHKRVAVVTGAGRGLGEAIAARLSSADCLIAVTDIDGERAQDAASRINAAGGQAKSYPLDVTDPQLVDSAMDDIVHDFGRIDILVCNAGITRDNLLFRMTDDNWHDVISTHLTGAFYCARRAQRTMVEQRDGRIVLIGSRAIQGNRGQSNYSAAKAGILGLARAMSIELGPFGITVNVVAPGHIETAMTHATAERMGLTYEQLAATVIERNAIKRVGQPEDVAGAVAYFASEEAGYVTGQVLYVMGRALS